MTQSSLDLLRKVVKAVNDSQTMEEKIAALSQAFELFSQETTRLQTAYAALKQQFESVNLQLEEANHKLKEKIFEIDITNDYLENILSNMSQGLLFISSQGLITTYNKASELLLGKRQSEVLYQEFDKVFGDLFFGFSMTQALEFADAPKLTFVTLPINSQRSTLRELEVEATFVLKNNKTNIQTNRVGAPDIAMGIIVLLRDITEIRQLQSLADRNDRMKELGEMAAMVAHEIRNPLGGIKGFASLLCRDLSDNPKLQEMANYIVEGTDNLNKLVTNILNYSRPLHLELISTDLNALVEDIVQHIRVDNMTKDKIEIITNLPNPSLHGHVDGRLFKSTLLNLLVNAIQAMPQGGKITVSLKKDNRQVNIQIRDTGEGIPKENLEKIFRPFFTTKPTGHGFGLAEVHRVIQAHNGTIAADSIVGQGTTFTIKIPCLNSD